MQVLAIDIDDSKKKSAHEEVIAFCKLGYTSLQNLGKFCIIDHFKNTAFTVVNSLCPKILSMSISKQKSFVYWLNFSEGFALSFAKHLQPHAAANNLEYRSTLIDMKARKKAHL